jgi:tRNA-binding protein
MQQITFDDFTKVQLLVGTVVSVEDLPQMRTPAYRVVVDFGPEVGKLKTSSQITCRTKTNRSAARSWGWSICRINRSAR